MSTQRVILITGTRKGIGRYLAEKHAAAGWRVIGCSRSAADFSLENYEHYCLDVADETAVTALFRDIRRRHGRLDALINNAGVAAMNSALLMPVSQLQKLLSTNVSGTFVCCREAAKLMQIGRAHV